MELADITRTLKSRWLLTVAVILVAAGTAAAIKVTKRSVPTGTATEQLMVDSPQSVIADLRQDTIPLTTRASVFAQFMASALIQQRIAAVLGVPSSEITTEGPFGGAGQTLNVVTPSEARGQQLAAEKKLYRLTFVAQDQLPLITVSAQAPTPAQAAKLADAVYPAVHSYLATLQAAQSTPAATIPERNRVTLRQLGPSQVGSQNSSKAMVLMVAAFGGILVIGLLGILALERMRSKRGAGQTGPMSPGPANGRRRRKRRASGEEDRPLGDPDMDEAFAYALAGARDLGDVSARSSTPTG